MSNNISSTTQHLGLQYKFKKFDINEIKSEILILGHKYKDYVRGKNSIVNEISYSTCFPLLDISSLRFLVGDEAVNYASLLCENALKPSNNRLKVIDDIYIVDDYVDAVEKAEEYRKLSTGTNRSTLIYFEHNHCFQSMQFMRCETSGKVVVNMRSCNLTENFLIDLAFSWIIANKVFNGKYDEISIIMNIASLHVLEKDR